MKKNNKELFEQETNKWNNDEENTFLCAAHKPLLMVIPSEGIIISCPVHKDGHKIMGPPKVTC